MYKKYIILAGSVILFSYEVNASVVGTLLPYQTYRDFAENKGQFVAGASDIPLYEQNGELYSTLSLAPMPDFSVVDRVYSVATLVAPQYVVSVRHNGSYQNVQFGYSDDNIYTIVDRNNSSSLDFHTPRLNKIVTEVAPVPITDAGTGSGTYKNTDRFPVFYRVGTGTQYIRDTSGTLTYISGAYAYRTGGTVGIPGISNGSIVVNPGYTYAAANGPLASYGTPGDSGSPVLAWDTLRNEWVLVAVLNSWAGISGQNNWGTVIPAGEVSSVIAGDTDPPVEPERTDADINWSYDISSGTGILSQGEDSWTMHGSTGGTSVAALDNGKNLTFENTGTVVLHDDVDQGAGTLTFNGDYRIQPENNETWKGGGIIINDDYTVDWAVNGVSGDSLHKLGTGTLKIEGTGVNPGSLSVGDGTVVLSQRPDSNDNIQAFSSVSIVSGRPTLVLGDDRQVSPDNISWGYRGGTLDINGNDLTFQRLKAADYGAVLANNADKQAHIILDYSLMPDDVVLNSWSGSKKGTAGTLYQYLNPYTKTTDYFILKQGSYGYFPTNQSSNSAWEFVGHIASDAQKLVSDRFNSSGYLFHGQLKGNLNVVNRLPEGTSGALVLDGSADTSGAFFQENGRLTLQGHPVVHAYSSQSVADKLASTGDNSVLTQPTSFDQEDWESRTFTFGSLHLNNVDFGLGRNATLNTDLEATDSTVTLGDSRVFIDLEDGNGTDFTPEEGISEAQNEADQSVFNGSTVLNGNTTLNIMNVAFNGYITGYSGSHVVLSHGSDWNMTKSSVLDSFRSDGGVISMVTDNWVPKTLSVNTMDASNMHFVIGVNTADNSSDRIDILDQATGGDNLLDLFWLPDSSITLKNALILASAPAGTAWGYFSFASLNSVYTPETQVQEKDGKVFWLLTGYDDSTTTTAGTTMGSGRINFKGTIVNAPCGIDPSSADQTIDFGQISSNQLNSGGISVKKDVDIKLVNCSFPSAGNTFTEKTVTAAFTGTTMTSGTNNTQYLGTSGGTNAYINMTAQDGSYVKFDGSTATNKTKLNDGSNTLHYSAWVTKGSTDVTPGDFTAVANFVLTYS